MVTFSLRLILGPSENVGWAVSWLMMAHRLSIPNFLSTGFSERAVCLQLVVVVKLRNGPRLFPSIKVPLLNVTFPYRNSILKVSSSPKGMRLYSFQACTIHLLIVKPQGKLYSFRDTLRCVELGTGSGFEWLPYASCLMFLFVSSL